MPAATPVLVHEHPESSDLWYRFAAGLCFLEAYYGFTVDGRWIGGILDIAEQRITLNAYTPLWVTMLLRPVVFAGLGAALWRQPAKSAWVMFWLTVAICLAGIASVGCYHTGLAAEAARSIRSPVAQLWVPVGRATIEQLPWFALASAGYWCHKRSKGRSGGGSHPWVICAVSWFAAQALLAVCLEFSPPWSTEIVPLPMDFRPLSAVLTAGILGSTAAALFHGWRHTRLLIWAGCILSFAGAVYWDVRIYEGVLRAVGFREWLLPWLRVCLPGCVLASGQWALVGIFVCQVPMTQFPDDGSPYPRHYCGNCHYNLRGLQSDRCPECGNELTWPKTSTGTPSVRGPNLHPGMRRNFLTGSPPKAV